MEQWIDIPGYEGFYQASSHGRIRSVIRSLEGSTRRVQKTILQPGTNNQGRLGVVLSRFRDDKTGYFQKRFQVHRLVLLAFHGQCPPGLEGCHNDGDHRNNRPDNLRWDTRSSNRQDMISHGTVLCGEDSARANLTEANIRSIRASNCLQRVLAKHYGVSQVAISNIRSGKSWRHVA